MPKEPLLTGCKFMRFHPNKTQCESLLKNVCIPWVLIMIEGWCGAGEGKGFCCWDLPAEIARPSKTANPPVGKH